MHSVTTQDGAKLMQIIASSTHRFVLFAANGANAEKLAKCSRLLRARKHHWLARIDCHQHILRDACKVSFGHLEVSQSAWACITAALPGCLLHGVSNMQMLGRGTWLCTGKLTCSGFPTPSTIALDKAAKVSLLLTVSVGTA
jgi:hypothetical protein